MASAESQSGMDMLCNAAGSDLMLSSTPVRLPFSSTGAGPTTVSSSGLVPHHQLLRQQQQQLRRRVESPLRPGLLGSPAGGPRPSSFSVNGSPSVLTAASSVSSSPDHAAPNPSSTGRPGEEPKHKCPRCHRSYKRADHLTRHLRSHDNSRPYCCSRCTKRFNRADLLGRHEATHDQDREPGDPNLPHDPKRYARAKERASEACANCAVAKARCSEEKPCSRCRSKKLICHVTDRRDQIQGDGRNGGPATGPSGLNGPVSGPSADMASQGDMDEDLGEDEEGGIDEEEEDDDHDVTKMEVDESNQPTGVPSGIHHHQQQQQQDQQHHPQHSIPVPFTYQNQQNLAVNHNAYMMQSVPLLAGASMMPGAPPPTVMASLRGDLGYLPPAPAAFQDIDFSTSWDLNFDTFTVPTFDAYGLSPQSSTTTNLSQPSLSSAAMARDASRGHAAFKRSPWLWEPQAQENALREGEGFGALQDENVARSSLGRLAGRGAGTATVRLKIGLADRDKILNLVMAQFRDGLRVPSLPSLDILNYLMQAHFIQEDHQCDGCIHTPSFDPAKALPELLASVISRGATFFAQPLIFKFGYALHEAVRFGLGMRVSCCRAFASVKHCV